LSLNAGGEAYTYKPSLYPLLIGAVNLIFRTPEFSGYLISVIAFFLCVIPLFLLTQTVYSRMSAHWASFLYVTNGYLHLHGDRVMMESLFSFFILVLLAFLVRLIRNSRAAPVQGLAVGLLSGMATLTRSEGILFYGAGILGILTLSPSPLRARIRTAGISLAVFSLILLPYFHFMHRSISRFYLGGGPTEILIRRQLDVAHPGRYLEMKKFHQGLTPDKSQLRIHELDKNFHLWEWLTKDDFALLRSLPISFVMRLSDLNKYLFGGLGFFFIGASLFSTPWDSRRKRAELLFLLFLSTFLPQLLTEFIPKRFYFYFPIFLMGMGNGIEVFRNWGRESFRWSQKTSLALAWGVCFLLAAASIGYMHRTLSSTPPPLEYKEMGLWMKKNIPGIEEERAVSIHPALNFYSGARLLGPETVLPYVEKLDDFLIYMAHKKARYFAVSDDSETPLLTESYRFLLDETQPLPARLRRLHTVVKENRKMVLYEIR